MSEYRVSNGYVMFSKLYDDTMGENWRAGLLEGRKVTQHKVVCEVNPLIAGSPEMWKRVRILEEGIRKSNIARLYTPEKIIAENDRALLVYDHLKGRNFEQVLQDAEQKGMPINFDLAFSIAIAIADIIELGSSIVVSGEKSFHGFLTPDNVIIDFEGKIYLKNYGVFQYLGKSDELHAQMESRYGAWLTPEFMRRDRTLSQSDIYHLGFILYRMLTGKYYSFSSAEDMDTKFANLTFKQYIPSTDKDFLTNVITFFKKTLNPDPLKRFLTVKEFKDFVSGYFHIEELSSITFNLAYFMNSLYGEQTEEEERLLKEELAYALPEPKRAPTVSPFVSSKADSEIVSNILESLDKEKKSKTGLWLGLGGIGLAVVVGGLIFLNQAKKTRQLEAERVRVQQELAANKAQQDELREQQQRLLEQQKTASEQEKKALEEKLKQIEDQQKKARDQAALLEKQKAAEAAQKAQEEQDRLAAEEAERQKQAEAEKQKAAEEERRKVEEAKKQAEMQKVKEGDTVALSDASVKPERLSTPQPVVTPSLAKKYKGKTISATITALVDENGSIAKSKFLGDVPDDIRSLILEALAQWKYKPAQKDGVRVKVWVTIPLKFVL